MKRLGTKRRVIAALLLALGLFSFFEPLIATDPPVAGTARWSVMDLARWSSLPDANNPSRRHGDRTLYGFWNFWIEFGSIYPLMLLALVSLCFFPAQRLLMAIGLIGTATSFGNWQRNNYGNIDLQVMLYGDFRPGRVTCAGLWLMLLTVMVVLAFVSFHESLDG